MFHEVAFWHCKVHLGRVSSGRTSCSGPWAALFPSGTDQSDKCVCPKCQSCARVTYPFFSPFPGSVFVRMNFVTWQQLALGFLLYFSLVVTVSLVILWYYSGCASNSPSRLRRWIFHEAHGHRSFPEEPPSHQRDPERERGARRPLCRHYGQNASSETPGSVFNGSSGKDKRYEGS